MNDIRKSYFHSSGTSQTQVPEGAAKNPTAAKTEAISKSFFDRVVEFVFMPLSFLDNYTTTRTPKVSSGFFDQTAKKISTVFKNLFQNKPDKVLTEAHAKAFEAEFRYKYDSNTKLTEREQKQHADVIIDVCARQRLKDPTNTDCVDQFKKGISSLATHYYKKEDTQLKAYIEIKTEEKITVYRRAQEERTQYAESGSLRTRAKGLLNEIEEVFKKEETRWVVALQLKQEGEQSNSLEQMSQLGKTLKDNIQNLEHRIDRLKNAALKDDLEAKLLELRVLHQIAINSTTKPS